MHETGEIGKNRDKQIRDVIRFCVANALLLTCVKAVAGFFTQSMAMLASSLDSAMDVASSIGNMIASQEASKPPDEEHKYGHAKVESLAGLFQSLFFIGSGFFVVYESVKRLLGGGEIRAVAVGIAVMLVSMAMTSVVVWRVARVKKIYNSIILDTERVHYATDILSNLAVIGVLLLVRITGLVFWDLALSLLVSAYVFKNAWGILKSSIDELLDRRISPVSEKEIEGIIQSSHPKIVGFHNFRSRRVGTQIFMDFHIEIRGENDFRKAHRIAESLVEEIRGKYPQSDVTVHFDPEGAR